MLMSEKKTRVQTSISTVSLYEVASIKKSEIISDSKRKEHVEKFPPILTNAYYM